MTRPRFTLRWLMIAVAIAGVVLGLWRRSVGFQRKADAIAYSAHRFVPLRVGMAQTPWMDERKRINGEKVRLFPIWSSWAKSMIAKYERAASYPWLPVEPDPPEPE